MALIASLAALAGAALLAVIFTALGHRLLRAARLDFEDGPERLLCCAAVGVIVFEAVLALVEAAVPIRAGVISLFAVAVAAGATEWRAVLRNIIEVIRRIAQGSSGEKILAYAAGLVLLFEGLAATAPLTGSDALHYHFAVPLHTLRAGFHPDFFLAHGFLTGQGHLLILAGLAAGTEKLALALLFLGGVLSAGATACITRRWTSRPWAWLAVLAFLLTPVVFWQNTAAGAPDIWMALFGVMGVLVIARSKDNSQAGMAALAGLLAGAAAGTKYTGCILAASLLLAFIWEARSLRRVFIFFFAALVAGIWPYARNFAWTDDPIFPFASRWFSPGQINAYALTSLLADTGASEHESLWQLVKYPLFASVDPLHLGFWQFFGPVCLAFAPLILLAVRNTPLWRTAIVVWVATGIGIGASTGMSRFLLPILPLALAAAFAGAAILHESSWRIARTLSAATIVSFLLLGLGGFAWYSHPAVRAAVGLTSQEAYLRDRAPDYDATEFVNGALNGKGTGERALVFFRHIYYLQVPFAYGDPAGSWPVDPARLGTAEAWRAFLQQNRIRWIVRSPDYPRMIAAPLRQLEAEGKLLPYQQGEISNFQGMRLRGVRVVVPIVILRVSE